MSISGNESIPGPGNGGVRPPLIDGERDPPRRWGWDWVLDGEGRKGSWEGELGDEERKIWVSALVNGHPPG